MSIEDFNRSKLEEAESQAKAPACGGKPHFQALSSTMLRIRVRDILEFFDTKPSGSANHATSLVAIIGEDLGAALFCEHLFRSGLGEARVLAKSPTPGTRSGKRLDRWFLIKWTDGRETLLQAEIKNWSAHAIGGKVQKLDAAGIKDSAFRINRWENEWDSAAGCFRHESVGKVFGTMKRPAGIDPGIQIEPLAIYWFAIHPTGQSDSLFHHPAPADSGFDRIWFFSMSSFLRSVKSETLDLDMPNAIARISWLNRLVSIVGQPEV